MFNGLKIKTNSINLFSLVGGATIAAATLALTAGNASAATFGFSNIFPGDLVGDAFNNDYKLDVTDEGSGMIRFAFSNISTATNFQSAIKQVAFSSINTSLLSGQTTNYQNSGTVGFQNSTQNLSQSNNISGWSGETWGAKTNGANSNAVQSGEILGIKFGGDFNAVIAAIGNGDLKIGIHVGSLLNGASDSYVLSPTPAPAPAPGQAVPEPLTILGAATAAGFGASFKRRLAKVKGNQKAD
jgi:hypothetical protein